MCVVKLRKLLFQDAKELRELFLKEKSLKDTGINVFHNEITLKFVHNWLKEYKESYRQDNPSFLVYGIINETNKLIGTVGVGNINYKTNSAEIGYWISEQYTNKGSCTLAIKLFIKLIPKRLNIKTLLAEVSKENIASNRVLIKNEFELKKEINNDMFYEIRLDI